MPKRAMMAGAVLPQPLIALAKGDRPLEDRVEGAFVPVRRGRVLAASVTIWDRPDIPHTVIKRLVRDEVILLGEERCEGG